MSKDTKHTPGAVRVIIKDENGNVKVDETHEPTKHGSGLIVDGISYEKREGYTMQVIWPKKEPAAKGEK